MASLLTCGGNAFSPSRLVIGAWTSGLEILNDREGVWRCRTILNCTEACPRKIRITKAIGEVKKAILKGSARAEPIRHPATSAA